MKIKKNSLEIYKKQSKKKIRKNTSVNGILTQSKLSLNRNNQSVMKYAVNKKSNQ